MRNGQQNLDRQTDRQLENCTFVKGVLLLIIIFSHSIAFWRGNWFTAIEPGRSLGGTSIIIDFVSNFHVYAFTLVAGYIYYYVRYERGGYQHYIPFLMNKVKRLLVPYISIGLLWAVPFYCLFYKMGYIEIAKRLLIGDYTAQLWYVLMLFWLFAIVWPFSNMIKKGKCFLLTIAAVAVYLFPLVASGFIKYDFGIFDAMIHFPFFVIGFKIRQYKGLDKKIPTAISVGIYVAMFAAKCGLAGCEGLCAKALYQAVIFAARISGSFMAWKVLQWAGEKIQWNTKVFSFYLSRSMPVYLLHQQIVYCSLWLFNGINPLLHVCMNFILALGVSLIVATLMMRTKFTRCLIGG